MDWTSAPITVDAPLEPAPPSFLFQRISAVSGRIEEFLERERAQLPLWFAVAFATGIATWLWLPGEREWAAFIILAIGMAASGLTLGPARSGEPMHLEDQRFARCSKDACIADIARDGRAWRLLAIRSRNRIAWSSLTRACADADIVLADRRLPRACQPRWLKLDRQSLEQTGGLAIYLDGEPYVSTVGSRIGRHPWKS